MSAMINLDADTIRKEVSGTILADLYDATETAFRKDMADSYFPRKYAAEVVAACYNIFQTHGIDIPKARKGGKRK